MKPSLLTLCAASLLALAAPRAQAQTYQLVWADEFNGSISPNWVFETGAGMWGNNEQQYYQRANATVNATDLMITAKRENVGGQLYTSARMKTKGLKEFTYGKIEARIKMPLGQGLWPACWMLGANIDSVPWPACGEIDIMEHVNSESSVYATEHWDNGGHVQYGTSTTTTPADYHVYSVEWDASGIKTAVDGVVYHTFSTANNVGGTEEFQRPFFLLLNLAVGGDWPGQTIDLSKLPATMYVDYVRVYQKSNTSTPTPTGNLIQAESYNAMSGVQLETTTDAGGGQNVGYIDTNDWMSYSNINFATAGAYTVEYRVASLNGGRLSCDLNSGSTALGNLNVPATGGWQTWTTITQTINIPTAGTYNFGIFAQTGGWNLNWFRISKQSSARTAAPTSSTVNQPLLTADLYPNPQVAGGPLQLQLNNYDFSAPATVLVTDLSGREVFHQTVTERTTNLGQQASLKSGVYLLRVTGNGTKATSKVVIQ